MIHTTIAAAFVAAQKGFAPALKTSTNPHFKSKYVDLAGCIEAVIDSLNSNGIALIQPTHECADGVTVETIFLHESGEQLSAGKLHVPATKNDPQGYGSALTYCRRYSLMAACGIAPEDDDGNAASKRVKTPSREDVAAAVTTLNNGAKKGTKGLTEALKTISDDVKQHIDPQVKKEIAAAAKMIDESAKEEVAA